MMLIIAFNCIMNYEQVNHNPLTTTKHKMLRKTFEEKVHIMEVGFACLEALVTTSATQGQDGSTFLDLDPKLGIFLWSKIL
jgi:hypothetical protein